MKHLSDLAFALLKIPGWCAPACIVISLCADFARASSNEVVNFGPSQMSQAKRDELESRVKAHLSQGEYRLAIAVGTEAIELRPSDGFGYEMRGSVYFVKGNTNEAISDYTRAAELGRRTSSLYLNRGNLYRTRNNFTAALADFDESIRLESKNEGAYLCRSSVYEKRGQFAQAVADASRVLALNPTNFHALRLRAYCHYLGGDFTPAAADWRAALALAPRDAESLNALAWLLAAVESPFRNPKEAIGLSLKACEVSQWKDGRYVDTLAVAYAGAGDFENAIAFERQGLEIVGITKSLRDEMNGRLQLFKQHERYVQSREVLRELRKHP